jgi:nicotinamidase-related amidase
VITWSSRKALRNLGVNTCVMAGVTTCVCVSTTIREGVEYNYRMIIVSDAVAEVHRDTHEAELKTMARIFADVKTSDEVIKMFSASRRTESHDHPAHPALTPRP